MIQDSRTLTIHLDQNDDDLAARLTRLGRARAGRIIYNGWQSSLTASLLPGNGRSGADGLPTYNSPDHAALFPALARAVCLPYGRNAYGMTNKIETITTRGVSIYLVKPQVSMAN